MKKLITILILFYGMNVAHAGNAPFVDIVKGYKMMKRAEVSLSACTVELTELDSLILIGEGEKPGTMTAKELEATFKSADAEHGKGSGLAECLTNIDNLIEYTEYSLLKVMGEDVETCTLYYIDLDRATSQNGGKHYEIDYTEAEDFFYSVDTEEGKGSGVKRCIAYTKQGLNWLHSQHYNN